MNTQEAFQCGIKFSEHYGIAQRLRREFDENNNKTRGKLILAAIIEQLQNCLICLDKADVDAQIIEKEIERFKDLLLES